MEELNESRDPYARLLPPVEDELQRVLLPPEGTLAPYYGMMHYHFGWADESLKPTLNHGGKRLRPLLCLLVCEAAGGDFRRAVPAAAAVEIIHNFSLVHDDIEDGDATRRHRLTLWKVWGVPQALNVGDGLFALAHRAMERLPLLGVPSALCLQALQVLDGATLALIQGQYLDLSFEERSQVAETEYLEMVAGKTAALFSCATQLGALLAGDNGARAESYRRFGHCLGVAFQMADDVLGIWGDSAVTGKPAATDILRKKKTLPVIYALGQSATLQEIYARHSIDGQELPTVLDILDRVEARRYAESLADHYKAEGLAELESTGCRNGAHDQLLELVEHLTARNS